VLCHYSRLKLMCAVCAVSPACVMCCVQLERQYYSSRAQFEADCMMIVQAAKAYHVLGGKGGKHPNPNVATAAENMVNEGLRVLQEVDAAFQINYWETRIQVGNRHCTCRQPRHSARSLGACDQAGVGICTADAQGSHCYRCNTDRLIDGC
jgi:hypothetical protein